MHLTAQHHTYTLLNISKSINSQPHLLCQHFIRRAVWLFHVSSLEDLNIFLNSHNFALERQFFIHIFGWTRNKTKIVPNKLWRSQSTISDFPTEFVSSFERNSNIIHTVASLFKSLFLCQYYFHLPLFQLTYIISMHFSRAEIFFLQNFTRYANGNPANKIVK